MLVERTDKIETINTLLCTLLCPMWSILSKNRYSSSPPSVFPLNCALKILNIEEKLRPINNIDSGCLWQAFFYVYVDCASYLDAARVGMLIPSPIKRTMFLAVLSFTLTAAKEFIISCSFKFFQWLTSENINNFI